MAVLTPEQAGAKPAAAGAADAKPPAKPAAKAPIKAKTSAKASPRPRLAAKVPREIAGRLLKRDMPLVPADLIAGRALITVIAIMTFLAALTAGTVAVIADAATGWTQDVSREMTVQVRPIEGRDLDADAAKAAALVRAAPGVAAVDPYSGAESAKLLQPWLGSGLDLGALPVPRLIVVRLAPDRDPDTGALGRALAAAVPGASLDDHGIWLARLRTMARATVLMGVGIFVLVLTAMLLAVAFATRGAMAGAREVIEVLHFVGAADGFISRQFQGHFLRLGSRGGAIGGGAAISFFLGGRWALGLWRTTAGGAQIEAMFGTFSLHASGYVAIVAIAAAIAVLTGVVSRIIVYRHLRRLM